MSVFFSCEGRLSLCFDSLDRIRPIFLSISSLIKSIEIVRSFSGTSASISGPHERWGTGLLAPVKGLYGRS